MDLNIPDTRQRVLEQRLKDGQQIVATEVALEFAVSVDTIRRDILSLEAMGRAHRVRGGAVPVSQSVSPLHKRLEGPEPHPALISAALEQVADATTLILDGGTTVLALARRLPLQQGRLVVTPSPWVAIACQENGCAVFLLGGALSASGGVSVGDFALERMAGISADVAVLGACGLDVDFGLSSDDFGESNLKKAMHGAARQTVVLTDSDKIGRRARHHTLGLAKIDQVITDAKTDQVADLMAAGVSVIHA